MGRDEVGQWAESSVLLYVTQESIVKNIGCLLKTTTEKFRVSELTC